MIRALLRTVLLLIIVAAIAAFFIGYQFGDRDGAPDADTDYTVGTAGTQDRQVDVNDAREAGARIGETLAQGANRAQLAAADAALTAKIKSKMALDDDVEAAEIDVDTRNGVVTLSGTVHSGGQRDRALRLARETDGVSQVIDRLTVR